MRGTSLLIAAVIVADPLAGSAAADPPQTWTVHGSDTYTEPGVYCDGEEADATWQLDYTEHITEHDDGRMHISASARGTLAWIQDHIHYTARFTTNFSLNLTGQAETITITVHGTGQGDDGSQVRLAETAHATVTRDGRVTVEFLDDAVTCTPPTPRGVR